MDVRCERCRAQYVFDDDQVTAAGLTVQCTNCGHVFRLKKKEMVVTVPVKPDELDQAPVPAGVASARPGGVQTTSSPGMPAARPPADLGEPSRPREWRVRQANGNIFTFRELTTLQKWIIEQKVSRDDEISLSGEQWKRLGNIAELASFFQVVEAAERSRSQPAVTPLPLPGTPLYPGAPPPPPSGFPPPSFAAPPPAAWSGQPLPPPPLPSHEVDLREDFEPTRPRPKPARARPWLILLLLLAAASAGAYVVAPRLLAPTPKAPPPETKAPPPAPPPVPAPAVTKAEPPPEASPQPPAASPPPAQEPAAPQPAPEPAAKPAPRSPKEILAEADRLLANGDDEKALELYGRVASDDPSNADAQAGRGLCYLDLESYAPAEASFLAALRVNPSHPGALLGLAETYRFQGKKSKAIPYYEKYLAEHPDDEDANVARTALSELRK